MKSEFAVRLGNLRRERGLSQRQVAAEFGISQALLSHYENGMREPRFEFVTAACDFYAVTADYLLGRVPERIPGDEVLAGKVREVMTSLEVLKREEQGLLDRLTQLTDRNGKT